jgi:hypothetical protein
MEATKSRNVPESICTDALATQPANLPPTPARRAYHSPRLQRLGQVCDLTYGSAGTPAEAPLKKF